MQGRNWKEYNEKLVRRGELYISLDFLKEWDRELDEMNRNKIGRPFIYPENFMYFLAFIHIAFLPFRQIEGFLRKLSEFIPKIKSADYSTICKRLKKLDVNLPENLGRDIVVAVDSSGIKVTNRGEWIRNKWKIRKGWIKVHIAVDVKTKKLLALEVTDERVSDGKMLKPLIEQVKERGGRVNGVYGDGGYDSKENFNYLAENGIEPVIKIRNNSSTKSRGSPSRAKRVREYRKLGYERWRDMYRYGYRWSAESFFSGVKRVFGETCRSKSKDALFQEVKMKFIFYNMLLSL
ncbi:IS5 family transposase [bacterium]|nr:IS5 family transposase [bacterium]